MTPARLAAIEERLREFEPELDAATRERMMRAIDPNYTRDLCLRVGIHVRSTASRIAGLSQLRTEAANLIERIDVAYVTDERIATPGVPVPFSPAEKPQVASTPQPPGETPCPECDDRGWTLGFGNEHVRCTTCRGTPPAQPPGHGPTPGTGTPPEV